MFSEQALLGHADRLDAKAAREIRRDLAVSSRSEMSKALGVLLGAAYPAMRPVHGWQLHALEQIGAEGWWTTRSGSEITRELLERCHQLSDLELVRQALRRVAWAEKARIAIREMLPRGLGGARIEDTSYELSLLAEVLFEFALAEAMEHVAHRFGEPIQRAGEHAAAGAPSALVTLGMGKLGGYELNCGSDIDVIFIYDTDLGGSELSLHDHWTRVARRAVANLEEPTSDGSVWRIDLRLRPEGSQGPIVNSLAAAERYYETWGRFWERSALLRARPIAGDRVLGELFHRELVEPYVYRRRVDPSLATSMIELTQQARIELSEDPARDLKLGVGGIREAEFFVQALQLIWGGQVPSLRVSSFSRGLERLRAAGLVSDREVREVGEAYWLQRRLEHAVQWHSGLQTHLFPNQPERVEHLAKVLGFKSARILEHALQVAREQVAEHFAALAPEAPRPPSNYHTIFVQLEEGGAGVDKLVAEKLGRDDLAEHLVALARSPSGLLGSSTRERYPELADAVIDAIVDSADPELAGRSLRSFFKRFRDPSFYIKRLAESLHTLQRFITVLGASQFVGDALTARPDLVELVFSIGEPVDEERVRKAVRFNVSTALNDWRQQPEAELMDLREQLVGALRRARLRVMVMVAVADLSGELETRGVTRLLSVLADEILEQALRFELSAARPGAEIARETAPKVFELTSQLGMAIIALGKLGGRDIGYGSDLDVLFVYDPELAMAELGLSAAEAADYFSRVAQRVIRLISAPHAAGQGYELDTRLRPSGSQGLLVTNLKAFARYHQVNLNEELSDPYATTSITSGAAWERQALLRARLAAGDELLGARLIRVAEVAAYEGGAPPAEEVHHLRTRMQRELAEERATGPSPRWDLKMGRGGLLDIEFGVQWLQMLHGNNTQLRSPDTLEAVNRLASAGHLSREAAAVLREGYEFLRRLEQRIHIRRGKSSNCLSANSPETEQLARRMGLRSSGALNATIEARASEQLLAEYQRMTEAVHATYLHILGLEEPLPTPKPNP